MGGNGGPVQVTGWSTHYFFHTFKPHQQDDLLQAFNNLLAQQPIWADVFFVI